jgi:hypothetical protein
MKSTEGRLTAPQIGLPLVSIVITSFNYGRYIREAFSR